MERPIVSIVMPVYNSARTLAASVESVQAQSWQEWELLLVDDGSSDSSRKLIEELASADSRIRSIFLSSNKGAALARNEGVKVAKGRYIAFLDSDDLWLPGKLEAQMECLRETSAGMVFSDYEWIDPQGNSLGVVVSAKDNPDWRTLTWGNDIGLSSVLVDREAIGDPLMLPLRLNHDFALWLDYLRKGAVAVRCPGILVRYRVLSGSLSQNKLESLRINWHILHRLQGIGILQTSVRLVVWAVRTSARRVLKFAGRR
ncbi:MAG TPA: glycosyltransferase family 2 protein [Fibrobacteria bacterium]|nr:glycosyltransferase family 2 protein [Fibrobacteria bacterium]